MGRSDIASAVRIIGGMMRGFTPTGFRHLEMGTGRLPRRAAPAAFSCRVPAPAPSLSPAEAAASRPTSPRPPYAAEQVALHVWRGSWINEREACALLLSVSNCEAFLPLQGPVTDGALAPNGILVAAISIELTVENHAGTQLSRPTVGRFCISTCVS